MPKFRQGSSPSDSGIWREVVDHNEYNLPSMFSALDLIIDIGAHIGAFSYATLVRGVGEVHAYEPFPESFALLRENVAEFGSRAVPHYGAVWRSDRMADELFVSTLDNMSVLWQDSGTKVPVFSLDEILRIQAQDKGRRVRLLKLDCEGAEYPILFTSKLLHLVDALCGEFHLFKVSDRAKVDGFPNFDGEAIRKFLTEQGFKVKILPGNHPVLGYFFASRG